MSDRRIKLIIESPDSAERSYECDSLHLPLPDGLCGVRPGHARAVVALAEGDVTATLDGSEVHREHIRGGFAGVDGSTVRIVKM